MSEKDIIKAGVKIVGLFIIILAICNILSGLGNVLFYYNFGKGLTTTNPSLTHEQQAEILSASRLYFTSAKLFGSGIGFIELFIGLYLCRGGNLFIHLLSRNGKKASQSCDSSIDCLSCGSSLVPGKTECSNCGWTYQKKE